MDILVTSNGDFIITIITSYDVIVEQIGQFDSECDMAGLVSGEGVKCDNSKLQIGRFVF